MLLFISSHHIFLRLGYKWLQYYVVFILNFCGFLVVASGHFLEIYRIFGDILTLSSLHIMH